MTQKQAAEEGRSILAKPPLSGGSRKGPARDKLEHEFWQRRVEKLMEEKRRSLKML